MPLTLVLSSYGRTLLIVLRNVTPLYPVVWLDGTSVRPSRAASAITLGGATALGGLAFQTLADVQKFTFKKANGADVPMLATGVWRLCRHPNYLGEIIFHLGLLLAAAAASLAARSAALLWQAPTAVPQGTGAGPGTSAFGPPTPGPCSTGPMVPLCSTLGIPMCTSGGGMFCSVNVQGTRCSAGGNGVCSASNMNTGVGGAKCSVRGPAVPGAPPSFCSTVGGICSSINGGDCSVQMESLGHCSVIQGAGGVCTTFDNMSLCSIRPDPTGVGGPGTCSTLLPNGSVGGGMICSG